MYREIQLLSRDDRGVQGVAHTGCVQWLTRDDRECTGDARECTGDARENTGVDKEKQGIFTRTGVFRASCVKESLV